MAINHAHADDRAASEATSLLRSQPSAHSTDSPTPRSYSNNEGVPLASSYEDLRQSVELQLQELNHASMSKLDTVVPNKKILNRKNAIFILLAGCILSVLLVAVVNLKPRRSSHNSPDHSTPSDNVVPTEPPVKAGVLPFSLLDPVHDLHLASFNRHEDSSPPKHMFVKRADDSKSPLDAPHYEPVPTNAWYQNFLMLRGEPSNVHRAYSTPYLVDVVGPVPGLRANSNHILSSTSVLQLTFNEEFGLTLGAAPRFADKNSSKKNNLDYKYRALETTQLGLTLKWNIMNMISTIVRGMAYITMEYNERSATLESGETLLPTIASMIGLAKAPIIDGGHSKLDCSSSSSKGGKKTLVEKDLELHFLDSDFTWLVFFSEPVWLKCNSVEGTHIQVFSSEGDDELEEEQNNEAPKSTHPLVIRAALLDTCTTGRNAILCREGLGDRLPEENQVQEYATILRQHSGNYPGQHTSMSFHIEDDATEGDLILDWDVKSIGDLSGSSSESAPQQQSLRKLDDAPEKSSLVMFALPHHLDRLGTNHMPNGIKYCKSSLHGPTCLVEGSVWTLKEQLPRIGLQAPRPPRAEFLPALADAVLGDINYTLPVFFERGAGDTYFSGKMLSKLARILLIAEELIEICEGGNAVTDTEDYQEACNNVTLPTEDQMNEGIDRLRRSVEVWINGTAETPFVYDEEWGGVVSCGCLFNGKTCDNHYPDCPAFVDQGLNFGNGFYNDQHFHYGYHIHGAAAVAHFDPEWGREHFEQVLLLVRNIANPSKDDEAFPLFRHKDWYQGSSWASGVPRPPYLNGKNQESSSEAIAAYESVALYGQVMTQAWSSHDTAKATISKEILKVGQLMTSTEIRSTQKYWHIKHNNKAEEIVPKAYTANVVGILWSTMAQFGTWFGAAPYLPYGIQLLPLTPISEDRDELDWVNEMYYPFSRACADFHQCTESGWSILQLAILATVGYAEHAASRVKEVLDESYENAGGNGQSKSNTLWYIATRPLIQNPVEMDRSDIRGHEELRPAPSFELSDCHTSDTCTSDVLNQEAGLYTCRTRINWLINSQGNSQWEACSAVGDEYPDICGPCKPGPKPPKNTTETGIPPTSHDEEADYNALQCDTCTVEQCNSNLNRCPIYDRTFVCTGGPSRGGCSGSPWTLGHEQCKSCCEMTTCTKLKDEEAQKITKDGNGLEPPKCPPCEPSVCYGKVNQCPIHTAPYICLDGHSAGGCSSTPWLVGSNDGQCNKCCEITVTC